MFLLRIIPAQDEMVIERLYVKSSIVESEYVGFFFVVIMTMGNET